MNRREVLRYTAWITGGALSTSLVSAILSGCSEQTPGKNAAATPDVAPTTGILHFFTPAQFTLVTVLVDTLLPRTDSPAATDVNVHFTVDSMLGQVFDSNYQTAFKTQWLALESYLQQQNFLSLPNLAQVEVLQALELAQSDETETAKKALREFKQHVIAYYLSKEEIAKNFLNYLPIPVTYKPCISLDDVNHKAWAL